LNSVLSVESPLLASDLYLCWFCFIFHLPCCSVFGCQENKGLSTICSQFIFLNAVLLIVVFCLLEMQ